MATAVGKKEAPPTKEGECSVGAETATPVVSRAFKAESLAELLEMAAKLHEDAAMKTPFHIYDLETTYDIDTGVWTGRLGKA